MGGVATEAAFCPKVGYGREMAARVVRNGGVSCRPDGAA